MEDKITRLSIKADRSGIAVYVPAHMSMDEICSELYRRFSHNACAFEKKGTIAVAFRGDAPTEAESHMIIDFLNDLDMNNVSFRYKKESGSTKTDNYNKYTETFCDSAIRSGYENVTHVSKFTENSIDNHIGSQMNMFRGTGITNDDSIYNKKYARKDIPYIFIGDIGRKQTLEIKGNVIILGNVAREAKVVSGRNIIVIGGLYGTAIAGKSNKYDSFVLAMYMAPKFLQIGNARSEFPNIRNYSDSSVVAANNGTSISITYI